MTQPLVSEPCDTPDRVTIFMNVTDRPYFGRFLTTIADADERRTTTRRYRRRRRSNGRSRTYPVTIVLPSCVIAVGPSLHCPTSPEPSVSITSTPLRVFPLRHRKQGPSYVDGDEVPLEFAVERTVGVGRNHEAFVGDPGDRGHVLPTL